MTTHYATQPSGNAALGAPPGNGRSVDEDARLLAVEELSQQGLPLDKLTPVTWRQLRAAPERDLLRYFAAWLFQEVIDTCTVRWIPGGEAGIHQTGAWPFCKQVPNPPPSKCFVYSMGLREGLGFEVSAARDASCNVRAFGGLSSAEAPSLPQAVIYHRVDLAGSNRVDTSPMHGTLSTLHSIEREQGRSVYALKIDGGGAAVAKGQLKTPATGALSSRAGLEWDAFQQLLRDVGPTALRTYDQLMLRVNLSSVIGSHADPAAVARLGAVASLSHGSGFRMYWRAPHPVAASGVQTEAGRELQAQIGEVAGAEAAAASSASKDTLARLAVQCLQYVARQRDGRAAPPAECAALGPDLPSHVLAVWDVALVREAALPLDGKAATRYAMDAHCLTAQGRA